MEDELQGFEDLRGWEGVLEGRLSLPLGGGGEGVGWDGFISREKAPR